MAQKKITVAVSNPVVARIGRALLEQNLSLYECHKMIDSAIGAGLVRLENRSFMQGEINKMIRLERDDLRAQLDAGVQR